MPFDASFREQIRDLRIRRGLSQNQLAKKAGMQQSVVSKIERVERRWRIDTMQKLACALDAELVVQLVPKEDLEDAPVVLRASGTEG